MNKAILMGRLTRDPEIRYTQSDSLAVARYSLAVDRRFKREGGENVDFIPCVAFGKNGEFAEKYLRKGTKIAVAGRIQIRSWKDENGNNRSTTEVVVEEQYFAESKNDGKRDGERTINQAVKEQSQVFYPIDDNIEDEDLPF